MGVLNKIVKIGTGGLVPDITGEEAAAEAAGIVGRGTEAGIAEQRRQFDITQQNLQPFLQAATGTPIFEDVPGRGIGRFNRGGRRQIGTEGGALQALQAGIEEAPLPPELQQFQFDPQQALNNPALQFQREQGEQQLDRLSGLNRNLGSGQRLIGAQQFGQGLASQFLGEEFNRQRTLSQDERTRQLQQFGLASGRFNERLNRLSGFVDVGRGTGTALGQLGGQSASNISNLIQSGAGANAAAALQQSAGINNLIGQGIGAAGLALGGGFGGFGGGGGAPGGFNAAQSFQPNVPNIGFQPTGIF